jgi:hypothetical protein
MMFVGRDGSMGLRHGQIYDVLTRIAASGQVLMTSPVRCPYGSVSAFLANWQASYPCCHRAVGTGHKMGCGKRQTIVSARLNDDGSLTAVREL